MGHPQVRWSVQLMTQDGGKTEQLQGDHEGRPGSTTKSGGMWKIRGGKVCSQGLDMTDQPICLVGYSASNFAGSARGLPFQEGDASGLGVFRSPSGVHHGRLQCAGPVAWPTAQRVWLRAPRDG